VSRAAKSALLSVALYVLLTVELAGAVVAFASTNGEALSRSESVSVTTTEVVVVVDAESTSIPLP
jgi:hypothetical protein